MTTQTTPISRAKTLIATAIAATSIAAASVPASAHQTVAYTTDPIKVVSYSIQPTYTSPIPAWGGTYMNLQSAGKVTISFVDTGNVAAKSVQFSVRSGHSVENIVDSGTFSPGTGITHDFSLGSQFDNASAVEVERVTFADGSSWNRS